MNQTPTLTPEIPHDPNLSATEQLGQYVDSLFVGTDPNQDQVVVRYANGHAPLIFERKAGQTGFNMSVSFPGATEADGTAGPSHDAAPSTDNEVDDDDPGVQAFRDVLSAHTLELLSSSTEQPLGFRQRLGRFGVQAALKAKI